MSYSETISTLIESLFENSKKASSKFLFKNNKSSNDIYNLLNNIIESKNNIARVQSAKEFFHLLNNLNDHEFKQLMLFLRDDRDINVESVKSAVIAYANDNSQDNYIKLQRSTISKRKILFRKLNSFDESTIHLVRLRERIINNTSTNQDYRKVGNDLKTLFIDWFNRGFLVLKPIDWNTPAAILEKIIEYESVHQINSWKELRDRINSDDRKCYAFFHPAMGNEPLIFVEVALTQNLPENINEILNTKRSTKNINKLNKAIFYSISNCQRGLDGISFGNYLIKDVVRFIKSELPAIKEFFTLSPVPNFMEWMRKKNKDIYDEISKDLKEETIKKNEEFLNPLIRQYLLASDRSDKKPNDSVTRFHIGNGASMYQINFLADTSANGLNKSCSFMVNYKYDLTKIKSNQEKYAINNTVPHKKNI
tara:strand:+ start:4513 stop:5781 length:1269 start_codon:yes stop_codon:yes gene_type:complete